MTDSHPLVTSNESTHARTPSNRKLIFATIAIGLFMSSIDATIVATGLPAIHRSLHASLNWTGWTITIYSLGMVVSLPIAGRVSDQFGRRRMFLVGIALFTFASLLCAMSTSIYLLVLFRALQALGGGTIQPSAAGIVADHFGSDRDRAIGLFGTIGSGGQVFGPVLGGVLVGYLSWRWIFFVNVPIGIFLMVMVIRIVPEAPRIARGNLDVVGLTLMTTFVLAANFGITNFGNKDAELTDPWVLAPMLCAVITLLVFVLHTRQTAEPFIPPHLFRAKGFAIMNVLNVFWGGFGFGVASLIPLYAQQRYHFTALTSGTLLTARGVGAISVGAAAAFALRRTGYRRPLRFGFVLLACGILLISIAPWWGISTYLWLSIATGITGLGNGIANPASRNASLQFAPDAVSAITGLRQMFTYVGVIFSVSVVTAILNRSSDPGLAQAHVMWVIALVICGLMVPLVRRVPEYKGQW